MAYSSLALIFEIPPGGAAANAGKKGLEDEEGSEPEDFTAALDKAGLERGWWNVVGDPRSIAIGH